LLVLQREFLEDEVVTGLQEGGEGAGATKKSPDVAEPLVEAPNHVEDQRAIGDDLTEGREIIGHLLQLAAVVGDGEVPLDEVAKPRVEVDRAGLAVTEELGLDGEPSMACGGALGGDDLSKIVGERGNDPGLDDAVHPGPVWRGVVWVILEHMTPKGEFAEDEEELVAPPVEVAGVDVEGVGDVIPDVADGDGLGVKLEKGDDLVVQHGGTEISRGRGAAREVTGGSRSRGGSSSRSFLGRASEGVAGALGGRVALLSGSSGLLLGLLRAGECSLALALGGSSGLLGLGRSRVVAVGGGGGRVLGGIPRGVGQRRALHDSAARQKAGAQGGQRKVET
jgi:hypothetical protein